MTGSNNQTVVLIYYNSFYFAILLESTPQTRALMQLPIK